MRLIAAAGRIELPAEGLGARRCVQGKPSRLWVAFTCLINALIKHVDYFRVARDSGTIPRSETKTVTKEISLVWDDPVASRLWDTAPCDSPRDMLELSTTFLLP